MPNVPGRHVLLRPGASDFHHTREDYSKYYTDDRKYFTLANFYAEFGKPRNGGGYRWPMSPHPDGIQVYRRWKELNGA